MVKNIVAANWKMYFNVDEAESVAKEMVGLIHNIKSEVVIFPSFVFLDRLRRIFVDSSIKLGAQNMHFEKDGAFTGEISPIMLKGVGCEYVIVGHSERRHIFLESELDIHKKIKSAVKHNLKPILCVGETLDQRKSGRAFDVVERQIVSALDGIDLENIVLAYEPVWAIGTGVAADIDTIAQMHGFIRKLIKDVAILYGGSVKDTNAKELALVENVDGFLVGSASLEPERFKKIVDEFESAKGG